eukprot:6854161-Alexandrium_andersonii.AAC.1
MPCPRPRGAAWSLDSAGRPGTAEPVELAGQADPDACEEAARPVASSATAACDRDRFRGGSIVDGAASAAGGSATAPKDDDVARPCPGVRCCKRDAADLSM